MKEVTLKELLEAGCHFGHQTTRWNPKMGSYIFTSRDRIHIFDLVKTKEGLEAACEVVRTLVSEGGQIVFIGTKRQSQDIIKEGALRAGMPYIVNRWVGGLITNWDFIKKRLDYLADLKAGKAEGRFKDRTKKENLLIDREIAKMESTFGGVVDLGSIPAGIFVADARKDETSLKEAKMRGVKTIAIVDSNANPDLVDYVIPANDDAAKSIQLIVDAIVGAVEEGRKGEGKKKEKDSLVEESLDKEAAPEEKKTTEEIKKKKKTKLKEVKSKKKKND